MLRRVALLVLAATSCASQTCQSDTTPSDARGPFYLGGAPETNRLAPEEQLSNASNLLVMTGVVYGRDCIPMANVLVEPWYAGLADENGNTYSVAGSSLQYRAQIRTDECGKYEFTSTFPESYPGRPIRHIHYRVSDERELLVTQLYFEGFISTGFNPDESQISPLELDTTDGSRRGKFNIYVGFDGTANATVCDAKALPSAQMSSGVIFFGWAPLFGSILVSCVILVLQL